MVNKKGKKNGRRTVLLGDSHVRGLAQELQFNLSQPGSSLEVVTNTKKSEVRTLRKKDVCIMWGQMQDVA